MKKRFFAAALLAILAVPSSIYAGGVSFGAWGRAMFTPAAGSHEEEVVPREAASWGWDSRIGFTIKGDSDNLGFQVDMKADSSTIGANDQQKIYAKLNENLTVEFGPNVYYDGLRGNGVFGSWDWMRINGALGEDLTFTRASVGKEEIGAAAGSVVHYNKDGLTLFMAHDIHEGAYNDEVYTTANMISLGQYGAGYMLDGIGQARVQYIGKAKNDGSKETYGVINAAVKMDQIVDDLYLDLGVFVPTDDEVGDKTKVAGYAKYKLSDTTTAHFLGEATLEVGADEETALKVGAGASVDLGSGLNLDTDVHFHNDVAAGGEDAEISLLAGVKKGYSNGLVGIGVQVSTGNFVPAYWDNTYGSTFVAKENSDDLAWAIPVRLEYWF